MTHHFDTFCKKKKKKWGRKKNGMKFSWRASKCAELGVFLMSLLRSVTPDRPAVLQDFARH